MSLGVPLDAPYYYQSWLAEWILFQTLNAFGLGGLQIGRALCLGLAFGFLTLAAYRMARRFDVSPSLVARVVGIVGLWSLGLACNNVDLRPQIFSVLLFGIWVWALGEFDAASARKRFGWGAFLTILVAIWANTHGAFAVSLITLGAWGLGHALNRSWKSVAHFGALFFACAIAVCFNPRGPSIYGYLIALSNNTIGQKYIEEWQAPGFGDWIGRAFWISFVLALALVFLVRRRSGSSPNRVWLSPHVVPLIALALMGARDIRSIIWFALWLPIALVPILVALASSTKPAQPAPFVPRAAQFINLVLLLMLGALPLALLPQLRASYAWPDAFRARFAPTPKRVFPNDPALMLDRTTPVEAVEFLVDNPPRGLVFTDMVSGSYMTWASHPQVRPWCEPRIELFPDAFWEDYRRLSSAPAGVSRELLKRGFSDALLNRETQKPLARELQKAGWNVVARGGETVLLRADASSIN